MCIRDMFKVKLILAAASEDEPTAVDLENERMEQAEPAAEPFPENGADTETGRPAVSYTHLDVYKRQDL